ncbi:hypothetical protein [Crateriforma conspicua]|uniref:Uncharacterized protein n=1 Tax=Crateriforma conspicua TaxID=2527996 RepID=A0A5C5Y0S9_9PLAN|nr:hypothetical protein [Crateriforma conspicua]TWT69356.1 hypothetical protein Pan14r_16420 [Crateriforma conspicua]
MDREDHPWKDCPFCDAKEIGLCDLHQSMVDRQVLTSLATMLREQQLVDIEICISLASENLARESESLGFDASNIKAKLRWLESFVSHFGQAADIIDEMMAINSHSLMLELLGNEPEDGQ